jgi:hypothetical protein
MVLRVRLSQESAFLERISGIEGATVE